MYDETSNPNSFGALFLQAKHYRPRMTFNDHDAPGAFALEFSADQSRLLHPLRRQHNLDEYGETYLFQKSWNKKIVTIQDKLTYGQLLLQ